MKVEMSRMPSSPYEIIVKGDTAFIRFFENAVEIPADEQPKWECDTYQLQVRNRPNLEASVQTNYDKWLEAAKEQTQPQEAPTLETRVDGIEQTQDAIIDILAEALEVTL